MSRTCFVCVLDLVEGSSPSSSSLFAGVVVVPNDLYHQACTIRLCIVSRPNGLIVHTFLCVSHRMTTFESFAMWFMRSMCARHVRKCISKNRKVNIKIEWNAYPSDAKNRFRLMNCLNMERLVLALGLTFIILFLCFAVLCLRSRHRRCSFVHLFVFCVYVTRDFHPYIRRSIVNT